MKIRNPLLLIMVLFISTGHSMAQTKVTAEKLGNKIEIRIN